MRRNPQVIQRMSLVSVGDCAISAITAYELFTGVEKCADPARERAKVLNGAATILHELGDYPAAHLLLHESLEIWRELGDKKAEAAALNNLSWIAVMRCEFDTARALAAESLFLHRELGDKRGLTSVVQHGRIDE